MTQEQQLNNGDQERCSFLEPANRIIETISTHPGDYSQRDINPIYTTEKIGKARMKIGKGNFHFRQGKRKMCSLHTSVLPLLVLF